MNQNNNYIDMFKLLKNHDWELFKKKLNNLDEDFDINLRDDQNEYLLTYAVLYNRIDIIQLLID